MSSVASLVALAAATAALAATPDYLPLVPGNQWIYRSSGRAGSATMLVEVVRTEVAAGRAWSVVRGFPGGEVWLSMTEDGTLRALDPVSRQEGTWAAFGAGEGESYATVIDPCSKQARILSRAAHFQGPVGEFGQTLHIVYPPTGCADAGITDEYYLPSIGLLRRTITTIAGPRVYDLIYARLGVTVVTAAELSFSLALDRAVYTANLMPPVDPTRSVPEMAARLTLRNAGDQPIDVDFSSGQAYDLTIKNESGEVVYRWSAGRMFTQALRTERIEPRTEKNYMVLAPLAGKDGKPLPQGRYTVEAWLTTSGPKTYSSTSGFQLQYVF